MNRCLILFLTIFSSFAYGQQSNQFLLPDGGGPFQFVPGDDITPSQRASIIMMLKENVRQLELAGKDMAAKPMIVAFSWPLRKAVGFTDNGYYGISNYVDENSNYPNQLLDYNCGNRTYDLASGYNHAGTDIFIWPFAWDKMANNSVEVIAAASGTIIGKSDGNFDQNCSFCTSACNWNAVYVQHGDGSVAWYGHLKTGTVTNKLVGAPVLAGEYLGVVGSSGNSTGPHLHFEVYTNNTYNQLVDPWDGACNNKNPGVSWWANQEAYRVSTLNAVMTHSAPPQPGQCPAAEIMYRKTLFAPGETIYFGSYYRDQQIGQVSSHKVYSPDNNIWASWNQSLNNTYSASFWHFSRILPSGGNINGTWKYEITYGQQVVSTNFIVTSSPQPDLRVSNVSATPSSVGGGGTVNVGFTIDNIGSTTAGSQEVNFYLSSDNILNTAANGDVFLGNYTVALNIGASGSTGPLTKALTMPCTTGGTYQIFVLADAGAVVAESNEGNNSAHTPVDLASATPITVTIQQNDTTLCAGSSIALQASGADSYSWSPATGLSATSGASVTATPAATTTYTVSGIKNGCTSSDYVVLTVLPQVVPSVSINYSGCPSSTLVFQATATNGGSNPQFEWFVNGNTSGSGSTHTLLNAQNNTQVYARLVSNAPCASPSGVNSSVTTVNCVTTSIPMVQGIGNIRISPNPSDGIFVIHLKMTSRKEVSFSVVDINGRKVYQTAKKQVNGDHSETMNLGNMAAGCYILQIQVGQESVLRKLVITR